MDILENNIANNALLTILSNSEQYKTLDNKSLVIFIDSKWGTGKTTLLNEFMKKHTSFDYLYYDAWKCDDWTEPMSPIVHCLKESEKVDEKIDKYIEAMLNLGFKKSLNVLSTLLFDIIQTKVGIKESTIAQLINLPEEVKNEVKENDLLKYQEGFEAYNKTKEAFSKYLSDKLDDSKIVFIIDELDRCKPLFAIETLEFIKHFFNECNMTFIISSDISQLGESIKSVYGNINYNIYLSKFYDYKFDLPNIELMQYLNSLPTAHVGQFRDNMNTHLYEFANELEISLRELQKIVNYITKHPRPVKETTDFKSFIFMLVLKQIDVVSYTRIINGQYINERNKGLPEFLFNKYYYTTLLKDDPNRFSGFLKEKKNIELLIKLETS